MSKVKKINPATKEDEQMLVSAKENLADYVVVRGKKFSIKWMHPETTSWITRLMLKDGNDNEIIHKCAALIMLNGFWKCHLFYWIVWRWFYYVKQYSSSELLPVIQMAQKKTAQQEREDYLTATIFLIALKDTKKQMTKAEADLILQEQRSDSVGK